MNNKNSSELVTVKLKRGPLPTTVFGPEPRKRAEDRAYAMCDLHSLPFVFDIVDGVIEIDASERYKDAKPDAGVTTNMRQARRSGARFVRSDNDRTRRQARVCAV